VLILADDLGYGDLAGYAADGVPTPSLDRLAREGIRFTQGYAAAAVCSPSRAGLMTGRSPARQGYDFNPSGADWGLDRDERILPELLHAAGYRTAAIGKWQLGRDPHNLPLARGFDEFFGFMSGAVYLDPATPGSETWLPASAGGRIPERSSRPLLRGAERVEESEYLTDALTREALAFLERHHEQPFFLYLAHHAVHTPLQAPGPYLAPFADVAARNSRIYAAMIAALDASVGAVLAKLDELGIGDDTLVVFLSDNGCPLYLEGACSNGPLAGGKRYFFEGGVRVPMMMRFPRRLPAAATYEKPVSALDWLPTLLSAAGVADPRADSRDGVDLLPYLRDPSATPHRALFWRAGPNRALRFENWKLLLINRTSEEALASIRPEGLLADLRAPAGSPHGQLRLLYDLSRDPGERRNLAASHPEIAARLEQVLDDWDRGLPRPRWSSERATAARVDGVPVEILF
jgi:arylsulfatase A-like enzyme